MCDTVVVVPADGAQGPVWFAKNSDREPGEAQVVLHLARRRGGGRLRATYIDLDDVAETNEVALSRPAWMWGAEMGANEHGLAIGNEAVFTRVPVAKSGLTGMDLVRLALERCKTADEALEVIAWLIDKHGQGGACGYSDERFAYHNAFMLADPRAAWLLETAGPFWAAERVHGVRTTSNVLTIGQSYDRLGPGTFEAARSRGWLRRGEAFDFRRCFGKRAMAWLSGGDERRACTARALTAPQTGVRLGFEDVARAMRDHRGMSPSGGARIVMPCAHASYLPTRRAGQTTGTQVSELLPRASRHFFTGTSAPCLSVLKPVPLGGEIVDTGPKPPARGGDRESLFWLHERLHRTTLRSYDERHGAFEEQRAELEGRAIGVRTAGEASDAWREHREAIRGWEERAKAVRAKGIGGAYEVFWKGQSRKDGI